MSTNEEIETKGTEKKNKKKKKFSKLFRIVKDRGFIGRTLSRFKLGLAYYSAAMTSVTAVMTFKGAFPDIEFWWIFALVPFMILGTIVLGLYLDKSNISSLDTRKTNETTHRFLLTSDIKSQEFQLMQTEVLLRAIADLSAKKEINIDSIHEKYQDYVKRWAK